MSKNDIALKTVEKLLGMSFSIPDYQRGYRWEKQQVKDLLEDIMSFSKKSAGSEEIYCIQPLVVASEDDGDSLLKKCKSANSVEEIRQYLQGSWIVVDGQQRLTTIYLILQYLGFSGAYRIKYATRHGSENFLQQIAEKTEDDAKANIDYYHMYRVYAEIKDWFEAKENLESAKEEIMDALLHRVCIIWYQVEKADEVATFTRLNIGKIPLTDAELIKALFLNRSTDRFENPNKFFVETRRREIALEWDQIERKLQNDEFWLFLHSPEYTKPTRIDYILDLICTHDRYAQKKNVSNHRGKNREDANKHNETFERNIGNDEHRTFRYFYEYFKRCDSAIVQGANDESSYGEWLIKAWREIKKFDCVFTEWYENYKLYHYIGYLTTVDPKLDITKIVDEWDKRTKTGFCDYLRERICETLERKILQPCKLEHLDSLIRFQFDEGNTEKTVSKTKCVNLLLLHNIETIIQQNEKLVSDSKYNLPNFSKFPFHLYKHENWQVEHIRPNAGDDLKDDKGKLYLSLAKQYFPDNSDLKKRIVCCIEGDKKVDMNEVLSEISQYGGTLSDNDKNRIWNFVLLDETTNKEYGNQIFPVKRAFISDKENGKKVKYRFENNKLKEERQAKEIAFVPVCTKNVFSKLYTKMPTTMINWNTEDAQAYWNDIKEKLSYYFEHCKNTRTL